MRFVQFNDRFSNCEDTLSIQLGSCCAVAVMQLIAIMFGEIVADYNSCNRMRCDCRVCVSKLQRIIMLRFWENYGQSVQFYN